MTPTVGAEQWLERGAELVAIGQLEQAAEAYATAVTLQPGADAHYNLGVVLQSLGQHEQAIHNFRLALTRRPDFVEAHNNLGVSLQALGQFEDALPCHTEAIRLRPEHASAHNNLGTALAALNRPEQALPCYEQAIALQRDYAGAYDNMGKALSVLGRLSEAARCFEHACDLAPENAEFLRGLANVRQFTPDDPYLVRMEQLASASGTLNTAQRIELHFALGKAYMDAGKRTPAFEQLLAGNALKHEQTPYDEPATLALLFDIRATFTPELLRAKRGLGDTSVTPVFIVGMVRSGTSLVEQILASHPRVFGAGELNEFKRCFARCSRDPDKPFTSGAVRMEAAALRQAGASYVSAVRALAPRAGRITDKMPANFRFLGHIHLALPNARIIHCRRNPLDTCFSAFSTLFVGDQPYTYDLGQLGRYYRAYDALMDHWRTVLPPGVMIEVQYEDLVTDFEPQARRIVAHAGVPWDDTCLDFHQNKRPVRTASAAQVRRPVYKSSVGRWQPYERLLQPLVKALQSA